MASTLRSYGNNTMRERGVDIAILGVDIAILGPRCRHNNRRCRYSKPEEAIEKGRRYRGREEREVSRIRRFEIGWSTREFEGTKSHRGRGTPCYEPFLGVRSGGGLGCRGTL